MKHIFALALAAVLAVTAVQSASADCISDPSRRASAGWTAWETVQSYRGVDLQVRYSSAFKLPFGSGPEYSSIQFRMVNHNHHTMHAEATDIVGTYLRGNPVLRTRKSFSHEPFTLPDMSAVLGANDSVETEVFEFDGRICELSMLFKAHRH